jgi:hypothetical protein
MRKSIMLLLAIASPALPANAQVSSYELFAAYCLGAFEQREQEGLANGLGEDAARQQAQTVGRLRQYLQIKIRSKPLSSHWSALSAAKEKGTTDQSECAAGIEAISTAQCIEECQAPIRDYDRCFSCVAVDAQPETCKWVSQCKPAPLPQVGGSAPVDRAAPSDAAKQPAPHASMPPQQSVLAAPPPLSPSQPQQRVAPVPAISRPQARPAVAPPPALTRQEDSRNAQVQPARQCAVSRPKPGFQVYLVICPNSRAMIGRTIDSPNGWTISEGVNAAEAIDFFMKGRYAR